MRSIGLDERLGETAQTGRYGRTCFLWKDQIKRLRKRGIQVTEFKEVKKAYILCYINWINPVVGTFSDELYAISTKHCLPVFCNNFQYAVDYLKQLANMTVMSAVISIENEGILEELSMNGFSYHILNDTPLTIYVDWSFPEESDHSHSLASAYRNSALNFSIAENHFWSKK